MERDPTFTARADLEEWCEEQVRDFEKDAPYSRNQVKLMIAVTDQIKRVAIAHLHLPFGEEQPHDPTR